MRISKSPPPPSSETVRFLMERHAAGEAIVLTFNGLCPLAIEDEITFRKLLTLVDWIEVVANIRRGLKEADEGKGISLEQIRAEMGVVNGRSR